MKNQFFEKKTHQKTETVIHLLFHSMKVIRSFLNKFLMNVPMSKEARNMHISALSFAFEAHKVHISCFFAH